LARAGKECYGTGVGRPLGLVCLFFLPARAGGKWEKKGGKTPNKKSGNKKKDPQRREQKKGVTPRVRGSQTMFWERGGKGGEEGPGLPSTALQKTWLRGLRICLILKNAPRGGPPKIGPPKKTSIAKKKNCGKNKKTNPRPWLSPGYLGKFSTGPGGWGKL